MDKDEILIVLHNACRACSGTGLIPCAYPTRASIVKHHLDSSNALLGLGMALLERKTEQLLAGYDKGTHGLGVMHPCYSCESERREYA